MAKSNEFQNQASLNIQNDLTRVVVLLHAMTTPGDAKDHGGGGSDEEVDEVDVAMRTPGDENDHGGGGGDDEVDSAVREARHQQLAQFSISQARR